jgi:hypothetical protein
MVVVRAFVVDVIRYSITVALLPTKQAIAQHVAVKKTTHCSQHAMGHARLKLSIKKTMVAAVKIRWDMQD